MYRRILTALKRFKLRRRQAQIEAQRDLEAVSEPVLTFWRDHGREWASLEASSGDLTFIGNLSERIHRMGPEEQQAEVLIALQKTWAEGFSDSSSAFPWDGLNDRLPAAAFVAFVQGAGVVFVGSRSAS